MKSTGGLYAGICDRANLPFLGLRVFPRMLRIQHGRYQRACRLVRQRERAFAAGLMDVPALVRSVRAVCAGPRSYGIRPMVTR